MSAKRFRVLLTASTFLVGMHLAGCDRTPANGPTLVTDAGRVVEASCGQCQFDLPGDGCTLAVRIDGIAYYVDGSDIDDHGDAHSAHGLCNAIRSATVEGEVEDGRFAARSFVLRPGDA
ncbi:MAG: DUF6370 family protein [Phycisphaerales bacterium]|nr:DUF6370 family protein [Phycisphaerales bacterium]